MLLFKRTLLDNTEFKDSQHSNFSLEVIQSIIRVREIWKPCLPLLIKSLISKLSSQKPKVRLMNKLKRDLLLFSFFQKMILKTIKSLPAFVPIMRLLIVPLFLTDHSLMLNYLVIWELFFIETLMMVLKLWIQVLVLSVLMLLNLLLMLIDIQLSVNLTKRLPTEFSVNKKRPYFSLMMISILIMLEFLENLPMRILTVLMDQSSVYLKLLKDLVKDLLSMLESRLDQLLDLLSLTMVDLINSFLLIFLKEDYNRLYRIIRIINFRFIINLLLFLLPMMSQSKLLSEKLSNHLFLPLISLYFWRLMLLGVVIVRNLSQSLPNWLRNFRTILTLLSPKWMPLKMNIH